MTAAEGLAEFSNGTDTLGDAYEYLLGQFAAGSGKKAGEFYTPQRISDILSAIVTLDSQEPASGSRKRLESILDFAEIGEFIDAPVKQYSSGMYIRLAFAVATSVNVETIAFGLDDPRP